MRFTHKRRKKVFLQSQAHSQSLRDPSAQHNRKIPVSFQYFSEIGLVLRPLVGSHQLVPCYYFRMARFKIKSKIYTFMPVILLIGEFLTQGCISPEYVRFTNMNFHFFFFWQIEKLLHRRNHSIKMVLWNLIVLYIKKPNIFTGIAYFLGCLSYRFWIVVRTYQWSNINDRNFLKG